MPRVFNNRTKVNPKIKILTYLKNFSVGELMFLLILQDNKSIAWYSQKFNVTYAHTCRIFQRLERLGVIYTEKKTRNRVVFIVPKFKPVLAQAELYIRTFLEMIKEQFSEENMKKWRLLK